MSPSNSSKQETRSIAPRDALSDTRRAWPILSFYERFEQLVTISLTLLVSLIVLAALIGLAVRVMQLLAYGVVDPADHSVFQVVFGMIFTVLIALEFNHSIVGVLVRRDHIVQARTVLLIALLALSRKFIILDSTVAQPLTIVGLSAAILALGAVYWLVRDQDLKEAQDEQRRGT